MRHISLKSLTVRSSRLINLAVPCYHLAWRIKTRLAVIEVAPSTTSIVAGRARSPDSGLLLHQALSDSLSLGRAPAGTSSPVIQISSIHVRRVIYHFSVALSRGKRISKSLWLASSNVEKRLSHVASSTVIISLMNMSQRSSTHTSKR